MIWIAISFVCAVLLCSSLLYLAKYKRELKNITSQLKCLTEDTTRKHIDISLMDPILEEMASEINKNIEKQEQMYINVRNHEQQLKESIANISHDLRTPLTSIMGYVFLAKNSEQQDISLALDIIDHKSNLLNTLIQNFYELSVLDDDKSVFLLEKVDIVKTLTDCLMGCFTKCKERNITPAISIPQHAVFVKANSLACERILQNLLTNAVQYTSDSVNVVLTCVDHECIITIENKTQLLDDESVKHIFDRFFMADKSRGNGNSGLGLFIVKSLLDKTGGKVKEAILKHDILSITISFPVYME